MGCGEWRWWQNVPLIAAISVWRVWARPGGNMVTSLAVADTMNICKWQGDRCDITRHRRVGEATHVMICQNESFMSWYIFVLVEGLFKSDHPFSSSFGTDRRLENGAL